MKKRLMAIVLAFAFIFSLAGCKTSDPAASAGGDSPVSSTEQGETTDMTGSTTDTPTTGTQGTPSDTDSTQPSSTPTTTRPTTVVPDTPSNGKSYISLKLANTTAVQEHWMGHNAISQGFIFMPDSYGRAYNDKQIALELQRMQNMELSMVRSYYEPSYAYQGKDSAGNLIWNWDSEEMQGLYKWLAAMKERGITVALNMGWGVSDLINANTTYMGTNPFRGMSLTDMVEAYSRWATESLREIIVERGYTNVQYGVLFTEPSDSAVYKENGQVVTEWELYVRLTKALDARLKAEGLRGLVKLTGPQVTFKESFSVQDKDGNTSLEQEIQWWIDRIDDYIDVYTFHWYNPRWPGQKAPSGFSLYDDNYDLYAYFYSEILRVLKPTGKEFWMDEYNYGTYNGSTRTSEIMKQPMCGPQLAQSMIAAMNSGVQNMLLWQLFATQWPLRTNTTENDSWSGGIHEQGLAPCLTVSSVPHASYYAYTLASKYMGGGTATKVYAGEGNKGIYLTMIEDANGDKSVMLVNTGMLSTDIALHFEQPIGQDVYRHVYDPITVKPTTAGRIIPADLCFENVKTVLKDTIPAGAVVIYTTRAD